MHTYTVVVAFTVEADSDEEARDDVFDSVDHLVQLDNRLIAAEIVSSSQFQE